MTKKKTTVTTKIRPVQSEKKKFYRKHLQGKTFNTFYNLFTKFSHLILYFLKLEKLLQDVI